VTVPGDGVLPVADAPAPWSAPVGMGAGAAPTGEARPTTPSRHAPRPPASVPLKYFIGEATVAWREADRLEKAFQLDSLLGYLVARHRAKLELPSSAPVDVTGVVGAAAFVFRSAHERGEELARAAADLGDLIRSQDLPHLRRLAAARRLLVLVLDPSEAPQTAAEERLGTALHEVKSSLHGVQTDIASLSNAEGQSRAAAERMQGQLDRIGGQVERLTTIAEALLARVEGGAALAASLGGPPGPPFSVSRAAGAHAFGATSRSASIGNASQLARAASHVHAAEGYSGGGGGALLPTPGAPPHGFSIPVATYPPAAPAPAPVPAAEPRLTDPFAPDSDATMAVEEISPSMTSDGAAPPTA
jgi:hypothetical protein